MQEIEINAMSSLALAHVGDAVYELMVRVWLCENGRLTSGGLHRAAVKRVSAKAQARAAALIMDRLTPEEMSVYKRGRNTRVNSVPHSAGIGEYHSATGLEALFGWLYLSCKHERLKELFNAITEGETDAT